MRPADSKRARDGTSRPQHADLWDFSLQVYGQPPVARACLALQDCYGVDVNVMLLLLWLASRGRVVPAAELRRIAAATAPWREQVVAPLRTLRRRLKRPLRPVDASAAHGFRERVKALELEAERLQQEALERRFATPSYGRRTARIAAAARSNLDVYARLLGCRFPAALTDALLAGLAATGPARARLAPRARS